jgi:hypothetical protein
VVGVADIAGAYTMHGKPEYQRLQIVPVNAGQLDVALIDDASDKHEVHGTFNDVTNQIVFNDAWFPGEILNTTFFTGSAIFVPGTTEAFALAGTWHELRLQIDAKRIVGLEHDAGSWYADCKQQLIA